MMLPMPVEPPHQPLAPATSLVDPPPAALPPTVGTDTKLAPSVGPGATRAGSDEPPRERTSPVAGLAEARERFLGFLAKRVGRRELAEELLHDAFVRSLERGEDLRDESSAVAWFYRSLRNAVVDHYRRRGAEGRALERLASDLAAASTAASLRGHPAAAGTEADGDLERAACACVLEVAETLGGARAEILRAVDVDGQAVRDYAARARISANAASVRLHRARAALRDALARACGPCCSGGGCIDCTCSRPAPGEVPASSTTTRSSGGSDARSASRPASGKEPTLESPPRATPAVDSARRRRPRGTPQPSPRSTTGGHTQTRLRSP
jgi:RNA polymerase sigma-70 factor (ECF subfamily)